MARVQHDPELATARTTNMEFTPAHRPSDNADESLKQYTCLYFGYASNLSSRTMKQRCPDSLFISLARLSGWRWMINETGYANIVPGNKDDEVWGSLCFLSRRDETALDESEGVPWLYEKKKLKVRRVPQMQAGEEWRTSDEGEEVEVLAYVDVQRLSEGRIEKEYVVWVRKAIEDALQCGMPQAYVDKYLARYLPARKPDDIPDREIMMVRTLQKKGETLIPSGFASWSRG